MAILNTAGMQHKPPLPDEMLREVFYTGLWFDGGGTG